MTRFCAFLAVAFSCRMLAGTFNGHVEDRSGSPIPSASVELAPVADASHAFRSHTDSGGNFEVAAPPGTYFLHIQLPGFRPVADAVEIKAAGNPNQHYRMPVAACLSCFVLSSAERPVQALTVCEITSAMNLAIPDAMLIVVIGHLRRLGDETYLEEDGCTSPLKVGAATWSSRLLLTKDHSLVFSTAADIAAGFLETRGKLHDGLTAVYGVLNAREPLLAVKCSVPRGFCLDDFGQLRAPAEIRFKGEQAILRRGD